MQQSEHDHDDTVFTLHRGTRPLLISLPHVGTQIPADQQHRYHRRALQVEDTDWLLDRLYAFAADLGASLLVPRHSRYLIDLNRPSSNTPMYAGQNNTELCPTRHFTGEALYREGQAPDEVEVRRRVATYWQPYHDALSAELERLHAGHGHAVLFDGHSIKSELPWLFDGTLPHMNLGTVDGTSCAPALRERVLGGARGADGLHPRHGRPLQGRPHHAPLRPPGDGVHAVQLEMCWRAYMDETPPNVWHEARAAEVTPLLRRLVQTMLDWRP
ncbi:MAG: N-formylglutamate deformylase [Betaproteobacteria bacterium]|nr:N-formylglutamate deformylase [Betaproteobacteria bacterium]